MLNFKHKYIFNEGITETGIYFCDVKINYKNLILKGKFVFCKKNISHFELKLIKKFNNFKELGIRQNSQNTMIIEIIPISYLGETLT